MEYCVALGRAQVSASGIVRKQDGPGLELELLI